MIPSLNNTSSSHKISKAALLNKGGEYLQQLTSERDILQVKIDKVKISIQSVNQDLDAILKYMAMAGKSNAINDEDTKEKLEKRFHGHVAQRASEINWKYWAFSRMFQPLISSFQVMWNRGKAIYVCKRLMC